ncbi:hypothetical protein Pcinc_041321 [Petrolisthes cinctipes]|uniref:Uncharacterized protein n=1 Tax=Petrolisthes cinctipes TaxID=88211 RepID=A0AAE1EH15_PETCI|nr:hypothetical protein Pcinc_041321 [Petrolisthes cinctipes]
MVVGRGKEEKEEVGNGGRKGEEEKEEVGNGGRKGEEDYEDKKVDERLIDQAPTHTQPNQVLKPAANSCSLPPPPSPIPACHPFTSPTQTIQPSQPASQPVSQPASQPANITFQGGRWFGQWEA